MEGGKEEKGCKRYPLVEWTAVFITMGCSLVFALFSLGCYQRGLVLALLFPLLDTLFGLYGQPSDDSLLSGERCRWTDESRAISLDPSALLLPDGWTFQVKFWIIAKGALLELCGCWYPDLSHSSLATTLAVVGKIGIPLWNFRATLLSPD